jgi:hypothetical protein
MREMIRKKRLCAFEGEYKEYSELSIILLVQLRSWTSFSNYLTKILD